MLRPLLVFGTRPEAIKMAPVVKACRAQRGMDPIVCSTGQHREMLQQVIDYFELSPDVTLDVMRPNQALAGLTARLLESLDHVLETHSPDCVVAQGDTTTVMAAAVTAFYRKLPLVHVEAGLRTGNLMAPWPEEFNRRVAGLTASLHCAPTENAARALLREGVLQEDVRVTGNTVIDALLDASQREREQNRWGEKYAMLRPSSRMVLITGHRRENFGAGFAGICQAISKLARQHPDVDFIYPVHLNPQVQGPVYQTLGNDPNIHLVPPASYPEFVWLMDRAYLILTDSGGVQEEAPSLGKPVLVMRDTTERPEAVTAGAAELVGTDPQKIHQRTSLLLSDPSVYRSRQIKTNPYGDGHSGNALRIGCPSESKRLAKHRLNQSR